jgi:hypothetical protein
MFFYILSPRRYRFFGLSNQLAARINLGSGLIAPAYGAHENERRRGLRVAAC